MTASVLRRRGAGLGGGRVGRVAAFPSFVFRLRALGVAGPQVPVPLAPREGRGRGKWSTVLERVAVWWDPGWSLSNGHSCGGWPARTRPLPFSAPQHPCS